MEYYACVKCNENSFCCQDDMLYLFLQELHRRNQLHQDPSKTKALQTIIEMKVRP